MIQRTCLQVRLICKKCGKVYSLEDVVHLMDDEFEKQMENIICNRL